MPSYFLFIDGGVTNGNLGVLSNWRNSNVGHSNLSAATGLPGSSDICWMNANVNAGTQSANTIAWIAVKTFGGTATILAANLTLSTVTGGTISIVGGLIAILAGSAGISGGTFNVISSGSMDYSLTASTITGGTFNLPVGFSNAAATQVLSSGVYTAQVTINAAVDFTISAGTFLAVDMSSTSASLISGGTFSGSVNSGPGTISGGTFGVSGTVDASGSITGGAFSGTVNAGPGNISGGTFGGPVISSGGIFGTPVFNGTVTTAASIDISGGTYNDTFNDDNNSTINDGLFFGQVDQSNSGTIFGGTFNGEYFGSGVSFQGGTFNATVAPTSSTISGGTFVGDLATDGSCNVQAGTFNGRVSFDNGSTWLYSASAVGVAPANKVLTGTTNLGVAGTAPAGSPSSGPIIRPGIVLGA